MSKKENFEVSMKELETVVQKLEGGEVELDEMLDLFEKGVNLTSVCSKMLDSAEQKIKVLVKNKDGEIETKDFGGADE